jgi:ribosomal protein S18 acetylase RimI-like enzyme
MSESLRSTLGGEWLDGLEVGALGSADAEQVVGVLSRGMRDNPLHVAVFGEDPERRQERLHRLFGAAFHTMGWQRHMLAARSADGAIVGVCGILPPGNCLPTPGKQLRMLPGLLQNGPRAASRTLRWLGAWSKHHPEERHWHLGPIAVDAGLQRMGVGSLLMEVFHAQMDAAGEEAYLETDKLANVRFYKRFGFEVVGEQDVLGVPNWFMRRAGKGELAEAS